MVSVPFKLHIQTLLCNHLQTITTENGYHHNVGANVYRGRSLFTGDTEQWALPMLSILEAPQQDEPMTADYHGLARKEHWALLLQGWVADDIYNPTDPVHYLLADVERCLSQIIETDDQSGQPVYPDSYLLGALPADPTGQTRWISGLRYGVGVCRPPTAQISTKAFFYLPVWIDLAYDSSSPYIDV